jgi:hypothetical protein
LRSADKRSGDTYWTFLLRSADATSSTPPWRRIRPRCRLISKGCVGDGRNGDMPRVLQGSMCHRKGTAATKLIFATKLEGIPHGQSLLPPTVLCVHDDRHCYPRTFDADSKRTPTWQSIADKARADTDANSGYFAHNQLPKRPGTTQAKHSPEHNTPLTFPAAPRAPSNQTNGAVLPCPPSWVFARALFSFKYKSFFCTRKKWSRRGPFFNTVLSLDQSGARIQLEGLARTLVDQK